ncbi:hypothetical protein GC167_03710 [bacterium]|nr:hypothetical protein [bacterium]
MNDRFSLLRLKFDTSNDYQLDAHIEVNQIARVLPHTWANDWQLQLPYEFDPTGSVGPHEYACTGIPNTKTPFLIMAPAGVNPPPQPRAHIRTRTSRKREAGESTIGFYLKTIEVSWAVNTTPSVRVEADEPLVFSRLMCDDTPVWVATPDAGGANTETLELTETELRQGIMLIEGHSDWEASVREFDVYYVQMNF